MKILVINRDVNGARNNLLEKLQELVRNVGWGVANFMRQVRQRRNWVTKISKMSVGRQKCQLDVSQKYQKCQLDVRNVSWTSVKNIKNVSWTSEMSVGRQSKISKMSVGRQKCQLDVKKNIKNVSWTSEMSVGRQNIIYSSTAKI